MQLNEPTYVTPHVLFKKSFNKDKQIEKAEKPTSKVFPQHPWQEKHTWISIAEILRVTWFDSSFT